MIATAATTTECVRCQGTGEVDAVTEPVRGYNAGWMWPVRCNNCMGSGTVEVDEAPVMTQRETLLDRAIREGLTAKRYSDDPHTAYVVSSKGDKVYRVTRTYCTCKAWEIAGRCKHQAIACHLADKGKLRMVVLTPRIFVTESE